MHTVITMHSFVGCTPLKESSRNLRSFTIDIVDIHEFRNKWLPTKINKFFFVAQKKTNKIIKSIKDQSKMSAWNVLVCYIVENFIIYFFVPYFL